MKDAIAFMKNLKEEMTTQETDVQASPRFWVLRDYKTVPCAEDLDFADGYEVYDPSMAESHPIDDLMKDAGEAIDDVLNGDHDSEETRSIDIHDAKDTFDVASDAHSQFEWLTIYGPALLELSDDIELVPVKREAYIVPNTLFITKQDAIDYIDRFGYNHTKDLHTFAMTALRSPKVEKLYDIIENTDWEIKKSEVTE